MIEVELSPVVKTIMAQGPQKTEEFIRRLITVANRLEAAAFKMARMEETIQFAESEKKALFDFIRDEQLKSKDT